MLKMHSASGLKDWKGVLVTNTQLNWWFTMKIGRIFILILPSVTCLFYPLIHHNLVLVSVQILQLWHTQKKTRSPLFSTPSWLIKDFNDHIWNMAGFGSKLQPITDFSVPSNTLYSFRPSDPQTASMLINCQLNCYYHPINQNLTHLIF